jgi:hypothetical protein
MKYLGLLLLNFIMLCVNAQQLPGFKISTSCDEQQRIIENLVPDTRILINAPLNGFHQNNVVLLIFYALPNGNTIEQTFGKKMKEGDDWHFDIQHIGAQTRFLRNLNAKETDETIVVAYLENKDKSWPAWKAGNPDYQIQVKKIVDEVKEIFKSWNPGVVLNGHSGGGRFIFSYLDAQETIPDDVKRIAFLDSDYGYEDDLYGHKITAWLRSSGKRYLCALAYNDSVVIYNGKPLVSPTGGTWYRTRLMLKYLRQSFRFKKKESDSLVWYSSLKRRVEIILKNNPEGKIYHTVQVERNGFIHTILSGTKYEQKSYNYFGKPVYRDLISDTVEIPIRSLNIPRRLLNAETGSAFMKRISGLTLADREEEIYKAFASGNVPDFLRTTVPIRGDFADSAGKPHQVIYEAMPDYLAVGNDADFCRVPMNPYTAQRIATLFGASLITAKISDHICTNTAIKLTPFNYVPVGNANELVSKFIDHNAQIEKQFAEAGGIRGRLVAGIKKDVILSERIAGQPGKVVIYGWHKQDGKPIQPVYSGHVWWYVDYSHGIRLVNDQVILDGEKASFREILKDPRLYTIFSNEKSPMVQTEYTR